jgi:hypothetical protein
MNKKIKKVKAFAVLIWGELQNPNKHIYQYIHEAVNKRAELIEEPQHCGSCECEGLDKKEVKVVPCEITYPINSN